MKREAWRVRRRRKGWRGRGMEHKDGGKGEETEEKRGKGMIWVRKNDNKAYRRIVKEERKRGWGGVNKKSGGR